MANVKLRTKFLVSFVAITTALTCVILLIVRHQVRTRVRTEILEGLRNSVITFQNSQRQREVTLGNSAELLANVPSLKALMTTQDFATIQDASADFWRLSGSDLFLLADRAQRVAALHTNASGFTRKTAQALLQRSLASGEPRDWWFGGGHLYEVFLQPIYFGSPAEQSLLGVLAVGCEIDRGAAEQVSRIASSQVAFRYGEAIVVSTLSSVQEAELAHLEGQSSPKAPMVAEEAHLGGERFLATSVELTPGTSTAVRLSVLKSYDRATEFLESTNRLLVGVGFAAVLAGTLLVFFLSHTFTRPLANLVAGVRALERGDFAYPLEAQGGDEVAELSSAFDRMRKSLEQTQEELLHSERLATMGRMASSISHDLRHPLTAILANAEFLAETREDEEQKKELYGEIRLAVNQMTDLIGSLLEFSRARESLRPVYGSVEETIQRAIETVRANPEFRRLPITVSSDGRCEGWFDPRKLERVFHNLLTNACEAVQPETGKVEVRTARGERELVIRVADNGPGIPEPVRDNLFRPFVSYGKPNGTGLGLAVVQKIVQDHGGTVRVESAAAGNTVFKLTLPLVVPSRETSRAGPPG